MSVSRRAILTLRKELALIDGAIRALERLDAGRTASLTQGKKVGPRLLGSGRSEHSHSRPY